MLNIHIDEAYIGPSKEKREISLTLIFNISVFGLRNAAKPLLPQHESLFSVFALACESAYSTG